MADLALALNVGSSSLKFRAAPMADPETGAAWGRIERIGSDGANLKITAQDATETREITVATHEDAVRIAAEALTRALPDARVAAVGHRIVHGGPDFTRPVEIDAGVLSRLETLVPLAPLHVPAGIAGIKGAERAFDSARQIACFDTAFHAGKPWVHDAFALPQQFYDEGIRRYGFHGISCQSITRGLRAEGYPLENRRVVIAHLGNGASVTAVLKGRGHASSMGFSTIDGLAMGTRSGRIDPGVLFYLHDRGMTQAQIEDLLYRKSGLLGLSGLSNDMRDLMASDDSAAVRAVEYFVARAVEEIARLAATMGGLDTVVFCGGIGENAGEIRDRIAAGLTFLPGQGDGVEILTRETREEEEILRAVAELCGHS